MPRVIITANCVRNQAKLFRAQYDAKVLNYVLLKSSMLLGLAPRQLLPYFMSANATLYLILGAKTTRHFPVQTWYTLQICNLKNLF